MSRSISQPFNPRLRSLMIALAATLLALAGEPLLAQVAGGRDPLPPSPPTRGDVSRILHDEMMDHAYLARLEAEWVEEAGLCVTVALNQVPRGLRVGNFILVRYVDVDQEKQTRKLALDFPKKPQEKADHIWTWRACADTDPRLVNAETDEIRVTVRQFDQAAMRKPMEVFELQFPTPASKSGLSLRRDTNGNLYAGG